MLKNKSQKKVVTELKLFWFENIKIQIGILLLLGTYIYGQSINFQFTNWDDLEYVSNNELIKNFTINKLPNIFKSFVMGNYHPLTILSFAVEVKLFGESASVMHTTNFSFHIANSILLLFLLRKINSDWLFTFFPALLFLVHPLHVESVAWVSERKDVLYCFFFFLAAISFFEFKKTDKKIHYFISIIMFILSLLSKGQAVVLPLALICFEVIQKNKIELREVLINKIPFFILSLFFGVIAIKAQSSVDIIGGPTNFTFIEQLIIGFNGLFFYLKSTVFPFKLATLYIYPDSISSAIYLKALLSFFSSIFIVYYFKKEKNILFTFVLFFVTIFPVLQFLPVGNAMYADRYYYIPSVGLFLFIAFLIKKFAAKIGSKNIFYVCFASSLLFSFLSFSQVQVWKNSFTLWEQVRTNYPKTPSAWYNTGNYFMKLNPPDYKTAQPFFVEAINVKANNSKAYNNLGVCYYNLGNYKSALESYTAAYKLDSTQSDLALNVGKANDMLAQYQTAITWYKKALKLNANTDVIYYNLGITNFKMGSIDSSILFYNKAIKINAKNPEFYNNLGTSFIYKKEYLKAIQNYDYALTLNTKYAEPYFNKALTLQVLGDTIKMIDNLKIAAKLGHSQAQLFLSQSKIGY